MNKPIIAQTVEEMRQLVQAARGQMHKIGLVPTMGNLHEGHLSLIRAARQETDYVVVSIFVNPAQFGAGEDFAEYPRTFERDRELCVAENVDAIFAPAAEVLYPKPYHTFVEVHDLQNVLCGATRPIHFRGVATVVMKLFNIVQPQVAYFGQKDAQQARILQQAVYDLNVPVEMRICPIVREADGLALSSRNQYLTAEQRRNATVLFQSLQHTHDEIAGGMRDREALEKQMAEHIALVPGAKLDYARIVDWETLRPVSLWSGEILVAVAVFFGTTRLIDNVLISLTKNGHDTAKNK